MPRGAYRGVRFRRIGLLASCALACMSSVSLAGEVDDRQMLLQRLQQLEQRLNQLEGRGAPAAPAAAPAPAAAEARGSLRRWAATSGRSALHGSSRNAAQGFKSSAALPM